MRRLIRTELWFAVRGLSNRASDGAARDEPSRAVRAPRSTPAIRDRRPVSPRSVPRPRATWTPAIAWTPAIEAPVSAKRSSTPRPWAGGADRCARNRAVSARAEHGPGRGDRERRQGTARGVADLDGEGSDRGVGPADADEVTPRRPARLGDRPSAGLVKATTSRISMPRRFTGRPTPA